MRESARSSQVRPSGVREKYPFRPIQLATSTIEGTGSGCASSHWYTCKVLVSLCAAKKAIVPQFCATRKLLKSLEMKRAAATWPLSIEANGMRTTAEPGACWPGGNKLVV